MDRNEQIIQQYYVIATENPNMSFRLAMETAYMTVFMTDCKLGDPRDAALLAKLKAWVCEDDEQREWMDGKITELVERIVEKDNAS